MSPVAQQRTTPKRKTKLPAIVKWLRSAGIGAELFGWGGLVLTELFWLAVILVCLGGVCIAIDLWFEPDFGSRLWLRLVGIALVAALELAFCLGIVFVRAPLFVSAMATPATYTPGTVIADIRWRPEFEEVNVILENGTDYNYDDLNLLLRADLPIAKIGQASTILDVSFEDEHKLLTRPMFREGAMGNTSVLPLSLLATDAGYRVHCGHLAAHQRLRIVLAVADIKWDLAPPKSPPASDFGAHGKDYVVKFRFFEDFSTYWYGYSDGDRYTIRPTAQFVRVTGTYKAAHRTRTLTERLNLNQFEVHGPRQP